MEILAYMFYSIASYLDSLFELKAVAFWFFFALATRIYFRDKKTYFIVMSCALLIPILVKELLGEHSRLIYQFTWIPATLIKVFLRGGFIGAIFGFLLAKYLVNENLISKTVKKSIPATIFVIFFASWIYIWWTH